MRIAIEASLAQRQPTGMGQYVINLLRNLAAVAGGEHEFLLFHSDKEWTGPDYGPQFTPVSYHFHKQSLAIGLRLNRLLRRHGVVLFHATCTTGAPPWPAIPVLSTIHDLYPLIHPEECSRSQAFFFKMLMGWTLKGSVHFITVSQFIANELSRSVGVDPRRITTIHEAPCVVGEHARRVRRGDGNFFLCVGAIDPRKGQLDLLEGYSRVSRIVPDLPRLTFVGPDRGRAKQLCDKISYGGLEEKVQWENFLDDQVLRRRFAAATALVFPSTYEGFGIPLLEAMCYGSPILCSDIPVFREIGGDYPIYVRPEPEAWVQAFIKFHAGAYDSHFARVTPDKVLNRYSWKKCADETLRCYEMVARTCGARKDESRHNMGKG